MEEESASEEAADEGNDSNDEEASEEDKQSDNEQSQEKEDDDKDEDSEGQYEEDPCGMAKKEKEAWNSIIGLVLTDKFEGVMANVLEEPLFSQFIDELRKYIQNSFKKCDSIRSPERFLYPSILKTIKDFIRQGYDKNEARKLAWQTRRFLLRSYIKRNKQAIATEIEKERSQ